MHPTGVRLMCTLCHALLFTPLKFQMCCKLWGWMFPAISTCRSAYKVMEGWKWDEGAHRNIDNVLNCYWAKGEHCMWRFELPDKERTGRSFAVLPLSQQCLLVEILWKWLPKTPRPIAATAGPWVREHCHPPQMDLDLSLEVAQFHNRDKVLVAWEKKPVSGLPPPMSDRHWWKHPHVRWGAHHLPLRIPGWPPAQHHMSVNKKSFPPKC